MNCYNEATGEMKCFKCKHYHSYYGCLAYLHGSKSFVQVAIKKPKKFVQNTY